METPRISLWVYRHRTGAIQRYNKVSTLRGERKFPQCVESTTVVHGVVHVVGEVSRTCPQQQLNWSYINTSSRVCEQVQNDADDA